MSAATADQSVRTIFRIMAADVPFLAIRDTNPTTPAVSRAVSLTPPRSGSMWLRKRSSYLIHIVGSTDDRCPSIQARTNWPTVAPPVRGSVPFRAASNFRMTSFGGDLLALYAGIGEHSDSGHT